MGQRVGDTSEKWKFSQPVRNGKFPFASRIIPTTMTLIVEIAVGILLAVAVLWLFLRIWYADDDEPGNYLP